MGEEINIDDKLKLLIGSKPRTYLTDVIKSYNEYCAANDLKERKLKGYSKKNKAELMDFLLSSLSEEEKERIFLKKEDEFIRDLILAGQKILDGKDTANKLSKYEQEGMQHNFLFKGFTWETKTGVEIGKKKDYKDHYCSCKIAESGGYCSHLFAAIKKLYKENKLNLNTFPIKISKENIKLIEETAEGKDVDVAEDIDIFLSPDYEIKVDGMKVTMKWGGQYAGSSVKDLSKEQTKKSSKKKEIDVELWLAKKVTEKITDPLKRGAKAPRRIKKDKINIISRIMKEEKLVQKMLKVFIESQPLLEKKLPVNKEELEEFLRKELK